MYFWCRKALSWAFAMTAALLSWLKKASEELRHACRIMAMRVKGEISVCPARVLAVFNGFS